MGLLNTTDQNYYNEGNFGSYQFTSLENIINQFIVSYVGEDKIISKAKRFDVAFHAQRALAELSFDVLKSHKAQEITVPASLQMILPIDYVNYTKISCVDSSGIKKLLYPVSKTSNPSFNPIQNNDGDYKLQAVGNVSDDTSLVGQILLDKKYPEILVGMNISGPYIPSGARVIKVTNSSTNTTITMGTIVGTTFTPILPDPENTFNGATLTFTNFEDEGALMNLHKSYVVVQNLDWNIIDFKINFNALADMDGVEIGMLVYHPDIPLGAFVEDISTTDLAVKINFLPLNAAASNSAEVTFVSPALADTETWSNYKSSMPSENNNHDDYEDDIFWPNEGERYGLDPQRAQTNGSFYIDDVRGLIHFSSNISGKTVILDYISDSLGTDDEMVVHKFAEEAMYKSIMYAILSTKANISENIIRRYKKERFAAIRTAKLRLSNLKLEELTQVLRGKSKQIKH
jgi:hypothetical protein